MSGPGSRRKSFIQMVFQKPTQGLAPVVERDEGEGMKDQLCFPKWKEPVALLPMPPKAELVIFWDGQSHRVTDRASAISVIKENLAEWMEPGDHIGWFRTPDDEKLCRRPSHACVIDSSMEGTDAWAIILHRVAA